MSGLATRPLSPLSRWSKAVYTSLSRLSLESVYRLEKKTQPKIRVPKVILAVGGRKMDICKMQAGNTYITKELGSSIVDLIQNEHGKIINRIS